MGGVCLPAIGGGSHGGVSSLCYGGGLHHGGYLCHWEGVSSQGGLHHGGGFSAIGRVSPPSGWGSGVALRRGWGVPPPFPVVAVELGGDGEDAVVDGGDAAQLALLPLPLHVQLPQLVRAEVQPRRRHRRLEHPAGTRR